ncbi:MAG: hypothetical protein ACI83W_002174, partial [Marinoscillum sp.]
MNFQTMTNEKRIAVPSASTINKTSSNTLSIGLGSYLIKKHKIPHTVIKF